jgi:dTDP-4-dehydrorhamnose 3,5-epimerase
MRSDWSDIFGEDRIEQINHSYTYPNIIRAWHCHLRGQVDYFLVLAGSIKLCAFDDKTAELTEIVSSHTNPQLVRIPGHYWHGFKVVGLKPALLVYYTTLLYNASAPDEQRRPWNDSTLIPKSINGKQTDERVGKSWDWNIPPHR